MKRTLCSITGCGHPQHARGWCNKHYKRWSEHGDPLGGGPELIYGDAEARFWPKVDKDGPLPGADTLAAGKGPCWLWTAAIDLYGYGRFTSPNSASAYCFAYELCVGPVPVGLELDHLCGVRRCVNPNHLEPVTHEENCRRGSSPCAINARKTHCIRGHEFTEENTWLRSEGGRKCRQCSLDSKRRQRARKQLVSR